MNTIINILNIQNEDLEKKMLNNFDVTERYQQKIIELNNKLYIENKKNKTKTI